MSVAWNGFRKILYFAFAPMVLVFVIILGAGYWLIVTTLDSDLDHFSAAALVGVIILVVYASMIQTGHTFVETKNSKGIFGYVFSTISTIFMIFVSAYGIFTALIFAIEGPVIARENLKNSRVALLRLEAVAKETLRIPDLESAKSRISSWKQTLLSEIENPTLCGVGPKARDAIYEIQKDLPNVRILNGTDRQVSCADRVQVERLKKAYSDMIDQSYAQHPMHSKFRSTDRAEFVKQTSAMVRQNVDSIDSLLIKISGVKDFVRKFDLYQAISKSLSKFSSDYNSAYQRLVGLSGSSNINIPSELDNSSMEQLVSPAQVPKIFKNRIANFSTWMLILISAGIDIFMIFATSNAISILNKQEEGYATRKRATHLKSSNVRYIWTPIPEEQDRA